MGQLPKFNTENEDLRQKQTSFANFSYFNFETPDKILWTVWYRSRAVAKELSGCFAENFF